MRSEIDDLRREMRNLLAERDDRIAALEEGQRATNQTIDDALAGSFAEILNILDNSHPEWSADAYAAPGVDPTDAGDGNLEAHDWYRQEQADTALSATSANALKAPKTIEPADHSLWAANEGTDADIPRWDKVNSTIEVGGVTELWDVFQTIPNDIVFPGQIFYIQFEAMLRTADALPDGVQAYAGFFDSTTGQEKYIEGGSFTITDDQGNDPGVSFGIPGSTSVNYKVLAYTDSGEVAESNVLNFPNAPAVFDANNHPRIKFSGVPGFIKFEIYREIAGSYVRQFTVQNTIQGIYDDIGNPPEAVIGAFPTAPTDKPRAYAVTRTFSPGSLGGAGWVRHTLTIFVPLTYDRSVTAAGKQTFRFGLTDNTAVERQVLIRRLGVSMGSGKWARSANDIRKNAHSSPSSTAAGAGSSGSGGIGPPPVGGGGGEDPPCPRVDQYVLIEGPKGEAVAQLASELTVSDRFFDPIRGTYHAAKEVKIVAAQDIWRLETENGAVVYASPRHPVICSETDMKGTPIETMARGLSVMTVTSGKAERSYSAAVEMMPEKASVVRIELVDGHIYAAGDDPQRLIVSHNRKNDIETFV